MSFAVTCLPNLKQGVSEQASNRLNLGTFVLSSVMLLLTLLILYACPLRVLNLHSQASPVARAPSMPPVETSYIPPPPPLIQDYRHYYHTTSDLQGKPALKDGYSFFIHLNKNTSLCMLNKLITVIATPL